MPSQHAPLVLRSSLLGSPKGGDSTLVEVATRFAPILAKFIDQPPLLYGEFSLVKVERASAASLDMDNGMLRLRGGVDGSPPAGLWGDELDEKAPDALDVTCGVYGIPGLTDGSNLFAVLVEAARTHTRIIVSEPVRAAIAFKWATFGKSQWHRQVLEYCAFVAGYMGGCGLLLLGDAGLGGWVRLCNQQCRTHSHTHGCACLSIHNALTLHLACVA